MRFLNRTNELARLRAVSDRDEGGLVVVYGRRRVGKTRLLLEWSGLADGLYTVADQSSGEVQRRYFAEAVSLRLPGFAEVEYRDWSGLLSRLARDASAAGWRGPLVLDELPYLVTSSPELPSVLQRWMDHEARAARLVVAIAGSSQRMMQGLALGAEAPLYGRAVELLDLGPMGPAHLAEAFEERDASEIVRLYTAWGGIPRYWELARQTDDDVMAQVDRLVLDPLGPLHREPDRLLLEELPPAIETRPLLDAIGSGAHRVSEIAGRLGRPATSMARPLERLVAMGLVRREIPFGEPERKGRRSVYRIDDPFFRAWFRVVAPSRALLSSGSRRARLDLLRKHWPGLVSQSWEELCRSQLAGALESSGVSGLAGPWGPAMRWWHGNAPEWDVVAESLDGSTLLVGEAKWSERPARLREVERSIAELRARPLPSISWTGNVVRVLFIPSLDAGRDAPRSSDVAVVTAADLIPTAGR